MTNLAMAPFTLGHVAITLIGIVSGLIVLAQMLGGSKSGGWTALFLLFTVLTSVTGYFFKQTGAQPTPAQLVGAVSLIDLAVALYALYAKNLAGIWRPVYIVTAIVALWLNVFVLIIQSFLKIAPLHALAPTIPPSGPVFGAVQGVVLLLFVLSGRFCLRRFHPRG